jgi:hypothetical protein
MTWVNTSICPARDTGSALVLPRADAIAMQHHWMKSAAALRLAPTTFWRSIRQVGRISQTEYSVITMRIEQAPAKARQPSAKVRED